MTDADLYYERDQTLVKHFILERYLLRLSLIVGEAFKGVSYIDCFSGPWQVRDDAYQDSSFGIAVNELRKAREKLDERSIPINLSCFFLESDATAYAKLDAYAQSVTDVICRTMHGRLEEHVNDIVTFVKQQQPAFPFVFIDPTGWTGFPLHVIRPLLKLQPGEVLINYMTWHARRWIEADQERNNFDLMYGDATWRPEIANLPPDLSSDLRDDTMVRLYAERIKQAGGFAFVVYTPVLHRECDTTHFHLVYATRSDKGLEVFKEVEEKAAEVIEKRRAENAERKRSSAASQLSFLEPTQMHDPVYYTNLRNIYRNRAFDSLTAAIAKTGKLAYRDAWLLALQYPLVWESDLKQWIANWRKSGAVEVTNLTPRQAPNRKRDNTIVWINKVPLSRPD